LFFKALKLVRPQRLLLHSFLCLSQKAFQS